MATNPFIGQLIAVAFNFPPKGWAFCNGQLLAISQNQALFSLLGTTYGGNGQTTFALPNLQGRVALGAGQGSGLQNYNQGQSSGEETHTLTIAETPTHQHTVTASAVAGSLPVAAANLLGNAAMYIASPPDPAAGTDNLLGPVGGSQPHENRQPFLVLNWCIALVGIFPSRN
jgi:microcystin-dependent protein